MHIPVGFAVAGAAKVAKASAFLSAPGLRTNSAISEASSAGRAKSGKLIECKMPSPDRLPPSSAGTLASLPWLLPFVAAASALASLSSRRFLVSLELAQKSNN